MPPARQHRVVSLLMGRTDSGHDQNSDEGFGPLHPRFAGGASHDTVVSALKHARRVADDAENALNMVTLQAVVTLSEQGLSPRDIGAAIQLPKSSVKRLLALQDTEPAAGDKQVVVRLVREAWSASTVTPE